MVSVFRRIMLVTAFLISVVIFLAGLYAGFLLDNYRIKDTGTELANRELDTESFVVESEFFDTFNVRDCNALNDRMNILGEDLLELGSTLTRYDAKSLSQGEVYEQLRRRYFLLEIKAYTLRKQMADICSGSFSDVILFFYNVEDNQEALNQGYALDYIVERYGDVVILSIDKDFEDPAVATLVKYYDVKGAPVLIVNFEKKFEGYISSGELMGYLEEKDS